MKNKIIALAMFACASLNGWAQSNGDVSGTIIDKWGNPVSGAWVTLGSDSGIGVATDQDGKFEISASDSDKLFIKTPDNNVKTVEAKSGKPMTIVMDFASQKVEKGFGIQQTLAESTGAISRVENEEFNKRSSLNVGNSLFGSALGLTALQNSGAAWDQDATFYIRGLQTLSDNGVLVLVDGLERYTTFITPEEVESVSVLRDASAVALYGYKGINGVVNIVTKRGKYKSRDVNVSYDHAFNWQTHKPKFVDAYTYASAVNEGLGYDGKAARYSQKELNAYKSGKYPYLYPNVDWVNEVFRDNGASNIYNITFRGGGQKMRYYTMLNLQDNSGFIANANVNDGYSTQMKHSKGNIRTNLDIDLTPTTFLQANVLGVLHEFSRPGMGADDLIGRLYSVPALAFPIKTEDGLWGGNATWGGMNPVASTQARAYSKGHSRALLADITLKQNLNAITQGLSAAFRLGYDNVASYWEDHTKTFKYGSDAVVSWNGNEPGETSRYTAGEDGAMGESSKLDWQNRMFHFNGNVDYQRTFGKHNLFSSFIYSYENKVWNNVNRTWYRQNVALYTHYGYDGRYIADVTLMGSGSNKLAPGHKWAFSPTVGAAWIISKENFMKDASFVDFLKLRASFGIINTDNIPAEGYWEQNFGGGSSYPMGNNFDWLGGLTEGRLASLNTSNEKAYKYNVGVDASFFKGLSFTADAYYERRKNIWVSKAGQTSSILGASAAYANAGIVDSKGVELGLDYIKRVGDVTLNLGGKFTYSTSEIKEQLEAPQAYEYLCSTGQSVGQIFGLQAVGYFVDQADINNSPVQQFYTVRPGDIKYKDQNGDNIINEFDVVPMGYNTSVPEIYYSFNLGAEWKGLGFSATFQGVANYTALLNATGMYVPLINDVNLSEYYYANRWTPENPNARFPRLTTEVNDNNYRTSSVWLADASFLKLRNCEIYYKLPKSFLSKLRMKSAKVYVRGVDLLCFDGIDVSDPESVGIDYPMTRSVNVGIAVGF